MTAQRIEDDMALEKLLKFLQSNNLPYTDIRLQGNLFIGYFDSQGNLKASGGLEFYGTAALLRSVAVDESWRGKSFGKKIVDDLIENARKHPVEVLYLLTETAHDFFLKKGFDDTARSTVPEAIRSTAEFSQLCPAAAHCMRYTIRQ